MGPYEYEVASIDGDYAVLRRTDNDTHDEILVARALLPEEIDIGSYQYLWECRGNILRAYGNTLFHRLTFNYWQK